MNKFHALWILLLGLAVASQAMAQDSGPHPRSSSDGCPVNMVRVGPLCMDAYEATVWSKPPRDGKPRGTQFGLVDEDYPCSFNGNDCSGATAIYAVSVPGKIPSTYITWFQAQQACAAVGKRLPTNAEWQMAAAGTPDTGGEDDGSTTCNTDDLEPGLSLTGSRKGCVSNYGVYDMVGNVFEWVADWFTGNTNPFAPSGGTAGPDYGDDFMLGVNPSGDQGAGENFPSAPVRGGRYNGGTGTGVFALNARFAPSADAGDGGFRCAR